MNIKPAIYENLSPAQRIVAAIEAIARKDDSELDKLHGTCPKKHYMQEDYKYSGMLQFLMAQAVAIENGLTGHALSIILCLYVMPDCEDKAEACMQRMADDLAAWSAVLENMGIDPAVMEKITSEVRHPIVNALLEALPEPNEEAVKRCRKGMDEIFQKVQSV
ncbi:MAG: hypothetical protein EOM20_15685 [Spartobacteria bacterium]|nr:hypothetical protein [Spartobacteria bacterium]